jgi:hypothetical protein
MGDYSYPSVFFCYLLFFVLGLGALYFLIRSVSDGYWGKHGEDMKYRMLEDDESEKGRG